MSVRVLVIDDEESIRFTFNAFLTDAGYRVSLAGTFSEGMDELVRNPFDVVLLDVILEGGSGLDLLRQMKPAETSPIFIVISGYPNPDAAADAKRLGAFEFIPKPVTQDRLLAAVKEALDSKKTARGEENTTPKPA